MTLQSLLVEDLNSDGAPLNYVCAADVIKHVKSLKNGKAADTFGVTAEHLKYDFRCLVPDHEQCYE